MPVLRAEPALFPESLFAAEPPAAGAWFAVHTKPRQEKSLARQLLVKQVPFYLPLIAKRTRMSSRIVTSHVPLFASYAFVLADQEQRLAMLETGRVVRAMEVGNQTQLWNDLRQIHRLIATGAPITPVDRLTAGSKVTIKSGAFAGFSGTVLRQATGRRFVVQVDFIQRGASVLLDDCVLAEAL